jgi:thiol-disulfide isomerase/thioredoxin
MKKPLAMILGLAAVSIGLSGQFAMPKYAPPVATKLFYSDSQATDYAGGRWTSTAQLQVWVLRRNPNASLHLILRQQESSVFEPKSGEREANGPTIAWGWCDLLPDGAIVPGSQLGSVDLSAVFIPLPKDTLQANQGWERVGELDQRDSFRLDSTNLTDAVWAIELTTRTPLDEVYQVSDRALVQLDTRQGLVVSSEGYRAQAFGNRNTATILKLDSISRLDTVLVRKFLPELTAFLRADSAARELENQAGEEPGRSAQLLGRADSILEAAKAAVSDSGLQQLLDKRTIDIAAMELREPAADEGGKGLKGKKAPDWKLKDLEGNASTLKQYQGKVVLLDFWYRGCPWCIRAMPRLNKLAEDFAGKPVQVLGMNIDKSIADARFVVDKLKLVYPNLRALDIPKLYGVTGYPTLFIIDQKGTIRDVHIGYSSDIGAKLTKAVRALLESE